MYAGCDDDGLGPFFDGAAKRLDDRRRLCRHEQIGKILADQGCRGHPEGFQEIGRTRNTSQRLVQPQLQFLTGIRHARIHSQLFRPATRNEADRRNVWDSCANRRCH